MSHVLQLVLAGVAQGCVYALVALGFVLIYKATETVNFAQGDLMMLGGFFALTAGVIWEWPYWATIIFAVAAMAVVGMLVERLVLRPVLGQPAFTVVMITIGVGYVLRGVVPMMPGWGTATYTLPTPLADRSGGEGSLPSQVRGHRHDRGAESPGVFSATQARHWRCRPPEHFAAAYMGISAAREC